MQSMFATRSEALVLASKLFSTGTEPAAIGLLTERGHFLEPSPFAGAAWEPGLDKLRPSLAGWLRRVEKGKQQVFNWGETSLLVLRIDIDQDAEPVGLAVSLRGIVTGLVSPTREIMAQAHGIGFFSDGQRVWSMGQLPEMAGSDWKAETWKEFWDRVAIAGAEPSALYQKALKRPYTGMCFSLNQGSLLEVSMDKSGDGVAGWVRKVPTIHNGLASCFTQMGSPMLQMQKWNVSPVLLAFQEYVYGTGSKDWKAYCLDLLNGAEGNQTFQVEFFSQQDWYELAVQSTAMFGVTDEVIGHCHTLVEPSRTASVSTAPTAELALAKQAYEDALLLTKEANHRIKNSLSMAASLLQLQSYSLEDSAAKEALGDAVQRLYTVSDLHEALYKHMSGTDKVQIKPFIESLADRLQGLVRAQGVEIRTEIQAMDLPNKKASRIGFLINELVLNAAKYAFPDQKQGFVAIYLTQTAGQCYLSVQDNGKGMATQSGTTESLGSTLIAEFAKDLQAEVRVETQAGTRYMFTFSA